MTDSFYLGKCPHPTQQALNRLRVKAFVQVGVNLNLIAPTSKKLLQVFLQQHERPKYKESHCHGPRREQVGPEVFPKIVSKPPADEANQSPLQRRLSSFATLCKSSATTPSRREIILVPYRLMSSS